MQPILTFDNLLIIIKMTVGTFSEIKGTFAEEALKLVILPFHDGFSINSCYVSILWIYIYILEK